MPASEEREKMTSGGRESRISSSVIVSQKAEAEPTGTWRDEEEQVLPKNNIPLVFFSLLLTTFLVRASAYFEGQLLRHTVGSAGRNDVGELHHRLQELI
jgi:hypothetical protein